MSIVKLSIPMLRCPVCYIAGTFIALQYLVCLTYIFLKLLAVQ